MYRYSDIPLTPSIAAEHILEYLAEQNRPLKRVDISRVVVERHSNLGGRRSRNPDNTMKRALSSLLEDGKISSPTIGWYAASEIVDPRQTIPSPSSDVPAPSEFMAPEEEIGSGDELVYVYFQDSDRRLAAFEQKDWWPCKVGFTAGNLTTRILGQGPSTGMAHPPVIGLVIKTDDGRLLEKNLHGALDRAEARMLDSIGTEWFETSPARIKIWYEQHKLAVAALRVSDTLSDEQSDTGA